MIIYFDPFCILEITIGEEIGISDNALRMMFD